MMHGEAATDGGRPRALVADDERQVRDRVRKSLEALGFEVVEARDGREAIDILEREGFDRVFLDVMMPYADGFEVLRWIRRHPTRDGTWVAMMTAMAGDRDAFDRLEYRADHYVLKPTELDRPIPPSPRLRVRTNAIDPAYVYPCSRRDVREAFGDDLLEKAWFGLTPDFRFDSRATHRPKVSGFVPIHVSVNRQNEATFYANRVRREDDSILLRSRLRDLMRGEMRAWTERKVMRTDTEIVGHEELIFEVRGGLLLTHELRYL